jgi:DNA adenine methylase
MINPPLKWHGGKHYLAGWIIENMPPHIHYVEPYAGGLSVLLRKPCEGISEVVNDLNAELTNFWRVLQQPASFETFRRLCAATPFSEVEYERANAQEHGSPELAAWAFFIRCRQSRQGLCKDFATLTRNRVRRGMNEQASAWWTAIDGLDDVYRRLQRVVILNADACDVIRQQDGLNTLFYCDPPYLHETRVTTKDYAHEMTREQHVELLETLSGVTGKFLLSGYRNELYDEYARKNDWVWVERQIDCKSSSKPTKGKRVEVLWLKEE